MAPPSFTPKGPFPPVVFMLAFLTILLLFWLLCAAPLMKHYRVSFLDDYAAIAGLDSLDPNYGGMIDQVVASRSSVFVGTYFSSFSAYIGRTRGYHGLSGKKMYYSHPGYWNQTHSWIYPHTSYSAREYPLGWAGIDEDDEPSEADFY